MIKSNMIQVNGTADLRQSLKNKQLPKRAGPTGEKREVLTYREPSPRRNKQNALDRLRQAAWKAKVAMYKYDHITAHEVRLMVLDPSPDPEADLITTLVTIPISQLSEYNYEALSYHWGESIANNPIYINSEQSQKSHLNNINDDASLDALRLYVKDNLYEALRHLRDKKQAIVLWADGICMDQGSEEEKGAQVPNMATIYSCAARVCVWLGLADRDRRTDKAMDFVGKIVKAYDIKELINENEAKNWRDLIFVMRSSWFSRRWIIQELALAKEASVHCGSKEVDWRDFSDAVSLFDLNFSEIRKLFDNKTKEYNAITELRPLRAKILVDEVSNTFLKSTDQTLFKPIKDLESLVSSLSSFETTDPRDTIYSFLNIARDTSFISGSQTPNSQITPPTPHYGRDLLQVYTDFVRYVVASSDSLDIICRQWALPERKMKALMYERLVKLPSWIKTVPESPYGKLGDGLNGRRNGDSFVGLPDARCYNASRGKSLDIRFGMGPSESPVRTAVSGSPTSAHHSPIESHPLTKTVSQESQRPPQSRPVTPEEERMMLEKRDPSIYVRGFKLGTVSWKTDPIPDGIIPQGALQRLGWFAREDCEFYYVPDKVWRTLVADRGPDGKLPPSWYHRACLRCLVHDTPNGHIATKDILEQNPEGIMFDYIKRVQAVTWNRVVLEATAEEYARDQDNTKAEPLVGIGPPTTENGDLVCIVFGCSVPLIIRPRFLKHDGARDGKARRPEKGDPDYYEFVGEAFIYGKMDGQAIEGINETTLQEKSRVFRLR
ncbi:hypothetical protein O1611_g6894 [Lasiodiplodia mahajangana]|uniref:Uncharacterized protein n=1 Tax=Lasiodiplodia mahajangana TaxID=1108764 RepID=A0ACC2JH34_9PEZI|nr:hypothetical protein O1611_g6894 [Lasiodiplodia mahajangana]